MSRLPANAVKLARKLADLEAKYGDQFRVVFEVLNELMAPPAPKRPPIGFNVRERPGTVRGRSRMNRSPPIIAPW